MGVLLGGGIVAVRPETVPFAGPAVLVFQDEQTEESEDGRGYARENDEEDLQARDLSVFSYRHRAQRVQPNARTRKARPMPLDPIGSSSFYKQVVMLFFRNGELVPVVGRRELISGG